MPRFVTQGAGRVGALRRPDAAALASLPFRDHEHDLAFGRMGFVMCEELAGGAAAEFLEFLCQLPGDAKLPIRHHINAGGERFG